MPRNATQQDDLPLISTQEVISLVRELIAHEGDHTARKDQFKQPPNDRVMAFCLDLKPGITTAEVGGEYLRKQACILYFLSKALPKSYPKYGFGAEWRQRPEDGILECRIDNVPHANLQLPRVMAHVNEVAQSGDYETVRNEIEAMSRRKKFTQFGMTHGETLDAMRR